MNRFFATLIVLGLTLVALVLCVRHTLEFGTGSLILTIEAIVMAIVLAAVATLVGLRIRRRAIRRHPAAVQPLRRLLSSVWS